MTEAFDALMEMFDQRAMLEERYQEAVYDHDLTKAENYQEMIIERNMAMHELYWISIDGTCSPDTGKRRGPSWIIK